MKVQSPTPFLCPHPSNVQSSMKAFLIHEKSLAEPENIFSPRLNSPNPTGFGDAEVILVDIMPRGQTINSCLYIQALKYLQNHYRTVQTPQKMMLPCSFQHDIARPHSSLKHTKQSQNSDELFFPSQIRLPRTYASVESSKTPSVAKCLGRWWGCRRSAEMPANKKFKLVPKHDSALVSRWRKAVEVVARYVKTYNIFICSSREYVQRITQSSKRKISPIIDPRCPEGSGT